jgi:hypothetical protein
MHTIRKLLTYSSANLRIVAFIVTLSAAVLLPMLTSPLSLQAVTDCSPNAVVSGGGAAQWLSGTGVNICTAGDDSNNYVNNINGVSTLSGWKWECVELVNRLYLTKGWTTSHWTGNGNTLVNNVPSGLIKQNNGAVSYINPGDVITFDYNNNSNGHAAIINSYNPSTGVAQVINQNTGSLYMTVTLTSGSLSAGSANFTSAWSGFTVQSIVHHPGGSMHWIPLAGDWDGNGTVTIGLYDPNTATFYLRNSNTSGVSDYSAVFGNGGNWLPVVGDWDGNGTTTIGVYDPNTARFYLSNSNTSPNSDISSVFGNANWVPLAGNWDGYQGDTIGVYDPITARFHLSNYNTSPQDNYSALFGNGGNWVPLAGNWDGYLSTTIGVYNPTLARFYLSNYNTSPQTNYTVVYGSGGSWEPVVGDWDTNGTATVGIYNPATATFYLSNSNTSGVTDTSFTYGNPN